MLLSMPCWQWMIRRPCPSSDSQALTASGWTPQLCSRYVPPCCSSKDNDGTKVKQNQNSKMSTFYVCVGMLCRTVCTPLLISLFKTSAHSCSTSGCRRPRVVHSHHLHSPLQGERKPGHWKAQPGVPLAVLCGQQPLLDPTRQQGSSPQTVGRQRSPRGGRGHRRGQQPRHKYHAHRSGPHQTSAWHVLK